MIYPVSPKKIDALGHKIKQLNLRESDFRETFVKSGGSGGQNVNKLSTCVVIKHIPTGLETRCQRERSQALNRFLAKRALVDKIEEHFLGLQSQRRQAFEKIRRQKRKRSKRAKEKMLDEKNRHSVKKSFRSGRIDPENF